jgi:RNA polymerase sigma-70 factor (ECF subfamily)
MEERGRVTELLEAWRMGDAKAGEEVMQIVLAELRRIAARRLRNGQRNGTLGTTELVHEAYIRLVGRRRAWNNRTEFYAVAAKAMRQVLVDRARRRQAVKRGGLQERIPFEEDTESLVLTLPTQHEWMERDEEFLALHEALGELGRLNRRQHDVVELRFFGGLTVEDTAAVLGIGSPTVKRDWVMARAWLKAALRTP